MRFKSAFLLYLVIPLILTANDQKQAIAILDLEGKGVSQTDANSITDRIRHELFQTGEFRVLEREVMEEILSEQGFQLAGCISSECAVEAGRMLGVKKMIAGSVNLVGNLYSIYLRMIDVETGEMVATASADCECPIELVVVKSTKEVVADLVETSSPALKETPDKVEISNFDNFFNEESDNLPVFESVNKGIIDTSKANKQKLWGLKVGYNRAFFYRGRGGRRDIGTFCIGGFYIFQKNDKFALQAEVFAIGKGTDYSNIKLDLIYVEFPVLAKFLLKKKGNTRYNFSAGPYFAINSRSLYYIDEDYFSDYNYYHDDTNVLDFGYVLSFGIEFMAGKEIISIELRGSSGLVPVYDFKSSTPTYGLSGNERNSVISLITGFYI